MADSDDTTRSRPAPPETTRSRLVPPPLSAEGAGATRDSYPGTEPRFDDGRWAGTASMGAAAQRARTTGAGPVDRTRYRPSRRRSTIPLIAALLLLGLAGAFFGYSLLSGEDEVADGGGVATGVANLTDDSAVLPDDEATEEDDSPPEQSEGDGAALAPTVAVEPVPPFVQATLSGRDLLLTGSVPSQELADGLVQAASLVYAPFIQSELVVDPQLPAPEWLAATPPSIMLLQTITEGTLVVSEGQITVSGQAASANDVTTLQAYLTEATGLPVETAGIEVTNLREAVYVLAASDGQLALSGALPTEEIAAGLRDAATAAYGEDNVFDASTVDETVAPTLWMYNPEALIATLSSFPDFEVRLDGGAFSASLSGGSIFPPDSTAFSPEFVQVLNFGVVVLSRDPSMTITIRGHTDSDGPDDYNLQLSQERADAVGAYFAGAGIAQERITAVGVGESEPVESNDTEEGRARNRRVEFSLQSNA